MTETQFATALAYRAGRYQKQLAGYRAFIPASLPPEPPIQVQGELQTQLSEADRAFRPA